MAAMSNYLENKLIDHIFRGVSFSMPTNLYVALYTAAPSDAVGGTEVVGSNYARGNLNPSTANWAATNGATLTTNPSSGTGATTSNNVAIPFNVPSGTWGTVTHFAVFDSISGGNMLFWGPLSAAKLVQSGDTVSIPISQIVVQLDD